MGCNGLQCVTVYCTVLQCVESVAVCYSLLQSVAWCGSVLLRTVATVAFGFGTPRQGATLCVI